MATARAVVLQKQVEGVLTDLMVRTNVQNVMLESGQPLSTFLATILTQEKVTDYVDDRINEILNVNPGLIDLLDELKEALANKKDIIATILDELAHKATKVDFDAVSAAVMNLGIALGQLELRMAANESAVSNHGIRLGKLESDIGSMGDMGLVSQGARVLLSKTVPADLRAQDLLLRIVDGA